MVVEGSYSKSKLGDNEYDDGTLVPLSETPILRQALLTERWENFELHEEIHWKSVLQSGRLRFAGTVLSDVRRQVELSMIFQDPYRMESFCVTLGNYSRFQTVA